MFKCIRTSDRFRCKHVSCALSQNEHEERHRERARGMGIVTKLREQFMDGERAMSMCVCAQRIAFIYYLRITKNK